MSSPCIGICQMDDASGYCIGCGRTIEEISGWSSSSAAAKQETLEQLPARNPGHTPGSTTTPEQGSGKAP